jgi:isopenicillin N synthase-like dioxygenase
VRSRKGEWVPFTADADTIVVNIGDMLQRLTNHVYPSTTHRVVNPRANRPASRVIPRRSSCIRTRTS